jgi:hypothetical protein
VLNVDETIKSILVLVIVHEKEQLCLLLSFVLFFLIFPSAAW